MTPDESALRAVRRAGGAVVLDKARGDTPLGCLEALRARRGGALEGVSLGYAGRLDPLASGVLIALVGDENREANRWRALDKSYDATVLLGAETDAWDALGLVSAVRGCEASEVRARVEPCARAWVGTFAQPLPPFAAHRIKGRSLWSYARAGETAARRSYSSSCCVVLRARGRDPAGPVAHVRAHGVLGRSALGRSARGRGGLRGRARAGALGDPR